MPDTSGFAAPEPTASVDVRLIAIEMGEVERRVLARGLAEWGGPARCTEALAVVMGFGSVDDLLVQLQRLGAALSRAEPLRREDWRRALIATEIVFASDVFGSGLDWSTTTGLSDELTINTLRALQRKVLAARAGPHDEG